MNENIKQKANQEMLNRVNKEIRRGIRTEWIAPSGAPVHEWSGTDVPGF